MEEKLVQTHSDYLIKINQAKTLKELDDIFLALFGKNGEITLLPKEFARLSSEEKQKIGPLFNKVKAELEEAVEKKRGYIKEEGYAKLAEEKSDFQPVEIKPRKGHLHPTTQFIRETVELFSKLGFQQFDAPHIDNDKLNFELLNIPADHPARDLWDTMWIANNKASSEKLLLRTHTSNAQIRAMRQIKPPIQIMSIGRCFRYEAVDARHEHTFEQFELVYVDKGLSMANLKYLSDYYIQNTLGKDIPSRLRPKYYPFVEPGFGIDAQCVFCKGKGCKVCGGIGWLEIGGAGMIHPNVLRNGGINPNVYSGIAWGPGVERMMMLRHGIDDIRSFLSGDLRFLEKF